MFRVFEEVDPKYAARCSDATLCSQSVGFFKILSDEIIEVAKKDKWLTYFEQVEAKDKVAAVMENKLLMDTLNEVFSHIQPLHRGKDAKISQEKRREAENALKENDLQKSFALSCQAVLRAPMKDVNESVDGGVSLALALWVRSEVLLRSNKPQAALVDLKLSQKERLPVQLRAQYYWRLGHCYKATGEPIRAKVSYELAIRLFGGDDGSIEQVRQDLATLDSDAVHTQLPVKPRLTLAGGSKKSVPAMSDKLKISENETQGRFAVAAQHVKTGDVLLMDKPYAACLLPEFYGTHCLHCFKRFSNCDNEAPVGCPKCSEVAFCSLQCKDLAIATYHKYECNFLGFFTGSGMTVLSFIALRMITQAGLDICLSIHSKYIINNTKTMENVAINDIEGTSKKSKMRTRKERLNRSRTALNGFAKANVSTEETEEKADDKLGYEEKLELMSAQIYSLCTHASQRKGDDSLKRIIMAMFLTECLNMSGFFEKCDRDQMERVKNAICELINCNLQLLQFNAYVIYETVRGQHLFDNSKTMVVAVGIYPTASLFNHDCYPAVARYFDGPNIILRAIRPLKPGETVSENYGAHFLTLARKERQRILASRYWFQCDCIACQEDWPMLDELRSKFALLRCPNHTCSWKFAANPKSLPEKCPKCSLPIDKRLVTLNLNTVDECISKYKEGAKLMKEERPLEAINVFTEALDLYHAVASTPHAETHVAQESLRSCFAAMGNSHTARAGGSEGVY